MENGNSSSTGLRSKGNASSVWGKTVTREIEWKVEIGETEQYPWSSHSPEFRFGEVKYILHLDKCDSSSIKFHLWRVGPFTYGSVRSIRWLLALKLSGGSKTGYIARGLDVLREKELVIVVVATGRVPQSVLLQSTEPFTLILKLRVQRTSSMQVEFRQMDDPLEDFHKYVRLLRERYVDDLERRRTKESLDTFSRNIEDFYPPGKECDVAVKVKGTIFAAHRAILQSRSPVMAAMFSHDMAERNTSVISIDDLEPEEFEVFLFFVYSGRVKNLTPQNVMGIYYAADKYGLPDLRIKCSSFIKSHLTIGSISSVIKLAVQHSDKGLLYSASQFFANNTVEILQTRLWKQFAKEYPKQASEIYKETLCEF